MNFETFTRRLETIKMLKDKINQTSEFLTLAFSDDQKHNKIYADGFNFLEDRLVDDLAEDWFLYKKEKGNSTRVDYAIEKETIEYIIYEVNWCSREDFKFKTNDKEYDCTVWNLYASDMDILTDENKDTFKNPKYKF